uniref:Uncharacterized protein n=1 Tax=Pristionchus pacificus TaxID=54126 RepID=A0A2A6CR74_PRIPA|eukprot:PDM80724.1 hypothetical protein PRIPAC_35727 [Pristionchus pacificus]
MGSGSGSGQQLALPYVNFPWSGCHVILVGPYSSISPTQAMIFVLTQFTRTRRAQILAAKLFNSYRIEM